MATKNMHMKSIHIILKWNDTDVFHISAPNTIIEHCKILNKYTDSDCFVWWGKVSSSGYLGIKIEDVDLINSQINSGIETLVFLYCPDTPVPSMHVGKLEEITIKNMAYDEHTPSYYRDLLNDYDIPYWFKISDITEVPLSNTLRDLEYMTGKVFDPVRVNFYPQKVYYKINQKIFLFPGLYKYLLEEKMVRCFKTGSTCARAHELEFNPKQVFVGCPFKPAYFNFYEYVIKPVCCESGYTTWIANEQFQNIDVMCKVCGGIQSSALAIIDITDWSANVLFELGLLYGLGKSVLIIKNSDTKMPVDLRGIEYVNYDMNNFNDAKKLIRKYLKEI